MADWKNIMDQADNAKRLTILHPEQGSVLFEELFKQFGADGMIFYKQAEALEALEDYIGALTGYRKAKVLFTMEKWKVLAQAGIDRVEKETKQQK